MMPLFFVIQAGLEDMALNLGERGESVYKYILNNFD